MAHRDRQSENFTVILFAKTPGTSVKTRIAATEGEGGAKQIYGELLREMVQVLSPVQYHVAYTGEENGGSLRTLFNDAASFFPQVQGDLGRRMREACTRFAQAGYTHFCIIGSDCPSLSTEDIQQTSDSLAKGYDVVLGPAEDGGYYLAGVNAKGISIFDATKWSCNDLFEETLGIARQHELRVKLLPAKNDIDTMEDYRRWRDGVISSKIQ